MEPLDIESVRATTTDGVGFLTWLGFCWGNRTSARKLNRQFFANNKRKHARVRRVWVCQGNTCNHTIDGEWTGHKTRKTKKVKKTGGGFFKHTFYLIVASIFSPCIFAWLYLILPFLRTLG